MPSPVVPWLRSAHYSLIQISRMCSFFSCHFFRLFLLVFSMLVTTNTQSQWFFYRPFGMVLSISVLPLSTRDAHTIYYWSGSLVNNPDIFICVHVSMLSTLRFFSFVHLSYCLFYSTLYIMRNYVCRFNVEHVLITKMGSCVIGFKCYSVGQMQSTSRLTDRLTRSIVIEHLLNCFHIWSVWCIKI